MFHNEDHGNTCWTESCDATTLILVGKITTTYDSTQCWHRVNQWKAAPWKRFFYRPIYGIPLVNGGSGLHITGQHSLSG